MIAKMIQDLRNIVEAWINDIKEMSNKDLEELKDKQSVINHMITEMKNMLEGINRGITEAEEWISELEDRMGEITAEEKNKGKE